jgi:uncharacterized membrane protein YraQ (UPF0718 family)
VTKSQLVLLGIALLATAVAYHKSPALAGEGARTAVRLFLSVLPAVVVGFWLGGMIQVLLPRQWVAAYAGEDSGLAGLVLATLAGSITPGGPFIAFPLVASLWKAGTGVGPLVAYLTAWSLLGFHRIIIYEGPIMGWRFTMVRLLSTVSIPPLVGWLAGWLFRVVWAGRL